MNVRRICRMLEGAQFLGHFIMVCLATKQHECDKNV